MTICPKFNFKDTRCQSWKKNFVFFKFWRPLGLFKWIFIYVSRTWNIIMYDLKYYYVHLFFFHLWHSVFETNCKSFQTYGHTKFSSWCERNRLL